MSFLLDKVIGNLRPLWFVGRVVTGTGISFSAINDAAAEFQQPWRAAATSRAAMQPRSWNRLYAEALELAWGQFSVVPTDASHHLAASNMTGNLLHQPMPARRRPQCNNMVGAVFLSTVWFPCRQAAIM